MRCKLPSNHRACKWATASPMAKVVWCMSKGRLNITGRAIVCPYAEVGMDVDKPHQLEIMRADLKKRLKKAGKETKPLKKTAATKKPAGKAGKAAPTKKKASPAKKTKK